MSDDKLEEERSRGIRAKQILSDPLIEEAFALITRNLHSRFEESRYSDTDGREKCWQMLHIVNEVRRYLETAVTTGKMADISLAEKAKRLAKKLW